MAETCFKAGADGLILFVKALPGASRNAVLGTAAGRLRVSVARAPEDGKANEELRAFLAETLGLPRRDVLLKSGERSRLKTLVLPASALGALTALLKAD